jgi:hypothetical protein
MFDIFLGHYVLANEIEIFYLIIAYIIVSNTLPFACLLPL